MSGTEETYLILCTVAAVAFALTLAWASWRNG